VSERFVLAACIKSRDAWNTVSAAEAVGDFSDQGKVLLEGITAFYTADKDATCVDAKILGAKVARKFSNPKHKALFSELVESLASEEVSAPNVVSELIEMRREVSGNKLASAITSGVTKNVPELLEQYQHWLSASSASTAGELAKMVSVVRGADLSTLIAKEQAEGLIPILPKVLNDKLRGGLRRGHHVIVFARPEIGKTLFVVNAVAGFLRNGHTVLYVGNEEPVEDLVLRVVGRLAGRTIDEIEQDPAGCEALAREHGYGNVIFAPLSPGTPQVIESLVSEYKPRVLIVDQLRNLDMGEQNYTVKLEKAATAIRNIAKKHGLVAISVTQAGDSASNKDVLDQGDVDYSNTGVPAQADVMIGVGASAQSLEASRRVLTLCKNKRSGNHAVIPVVVDTAYNRIRGE
jgi:KaiC/GvpD/RAD55 family RecA-like ATPase